MVDDPHGWPTQSTPLSAFVILPKTTSVQLGPPHTNTLIKSKELRAKKKIFIQIQKDSCIEVYRYISN